jgi:hypothetical protein
MDLLLHGVLKQMIHASLFVVLGRFVAGESVGFLVTMRPWPFSQTNKGEKQLDLDHESSS